MTKFHSLVFVALLYYVSEKSCWAAQSDVCTIGNIKGTATFFFCTLMDVGPCFFSVSFKLYSRENPEGISITLKDIKDKCLDRNDRKVYILVHGWFKLFYYNWMLDVANPLLKAEDCYVLIPDYSALSTDFFSRAYRCIKEKVAPQIAEFLIYLVQNCSFQRANLICMGHSLGGQTCGIIGNYIKLGQIVGLDSSDICAYDEVDKNRLTPDKADCTMILITSPFGRPDILPWAFTPYPRKNGSYIMADISLVFNGGIYQPLKSECSPRVLFQLSYFSPKCLMSYHFFCIKLLISMIKQEGNFVGVRCDSCEDFNQVKCIDCKENKDACLPLGLNICPGMSGKRGTYYIKTLGKAPYSGYEYGITLILGSCTSSENLSSVRSIKVTIKGDGGTEEIKLDRESSSVPLQLGTMMVLEKSLGKISAADVEWYGSRRSRDKVICITAVRIVLINANKVEPFSEENSLEKSSCNGQLEASSPCTFT